jgi:C-terminal processing protease CtpA/Prc
MIAYTREFLIILAMLTLAACGGGDGGGIGGSTGGGGGGSGSGWQPGVFEDYNSFYARCQNPRSGTNPFSGQPYPDVQGTTLDENNFLRSFSNDVYLWYDEIVDRDPALYDSTLDYFDLLKTTATTASGQPKDKFHFTYDTEAYNQLAQGGVSAGYGIQWAFLSTRPPRELLIAYTEPDSPATNLPVPLARGAKVLAIDGVDIDDTSSSGIDILNAGISPAEIGEVHTFTVLDQGAESSRDVTLTSAEITAAPVQNTQVFDTLTGQVGYMLFNDHIATAESALIDAVNFFKAHDDGFGNLGIDDLVLDLRYNGGGYLDIASELAYMIAGPTPTAGRIFEELQFNDKHPVTNPITGQAIVPTPFHSESQGFSVSAGQSLPSLDLARVYVITGPGTCSASEAVMNGLRGVGVEVIQVGSTTCGKPYGFYAIDNCGTTYFTIQFRGVNAANFGDYTDGFSPSSAPANLAEVPGCSVGDDFTKQLGDPTENRVATALFYRDGETCPAAAAAALGSGVPAAAASNGAEPIVPKSPWHTNRILKR